jgi:hypothetical protein
MLYTFFLFHFFPISIQQNSVPNSFHNSQTTCTLPRHTNLHWPTYDGTVAGVRNMSTITVTGTQQPPPPSTIAMQHLHMTSGGGPIPRPRVFIGMPEEQHMLSSSATDTPLMTKRESTV